MASQTFNMNLRGYWREKNSDSIPAKSGVYFVYECTKNSDGSITLHKLIYIGEAGNARDRIQNHEKKDRWKKHVRNGNELCYSFGAVESDHRDRVEAAYIFKHKPPENDEYVDNFPFDETTVRSEGKTTLLNTNFTVQRTE